MYLRRAHVGYYLIDRGFEELKRKSAITRASSIASRQTLRRNSDDIYIGGIEVLTVILIAAVSAAADPELLHLRRPDHRLPHAAHSRRHRARSI